MLLPRRTALAFLAMPLAPALLAGCGFRLRNSQLDSQSLPFASIAITPDGPGGVAGDLARFLADRVQPAAPGLGGEPPEVILDILQEAREKLAVGVNASGQVREYELRLRVSFKLRTGKGVELIPPSVIEQRRTISYNESAVLAKEAEESLLYRDMQSDVVQQLLRRLAAAKMPGKVTTPEAAVAPKAIPAPN